MADKPKTKLLVDPATQKAYEEEKVAKRTERIKAFLEDIKATCNKHEIDLVPQLNIQPNAIGAAFGVSIRDEQNAEERR